MENYRLNEKDTAKLLKNCRLGSPLYIFDTVTSTFDKIKEYPRLEGLTVAAKIQTAGRGRLGRSWSSEEGGVYFSFNLTPDVSPEEAAFATITCALGTVKALREYGSCSIKWPNDIVMNGKKICGILTTMTTNGSKLDYICVGTGINVNKDSFDESLPHASSIKLETGREQNENKVLASVLKSIEKVYTSYTKERILEEYSENCITIGSDVTVHYTDGRGDFTGKSLGITESGALVVQNGNNTVTVGSGEVSVRGLYGYV
ncbi:MAG: biotin--[Clostridia bacterium]|nr:biotin--[acetyl-CoA-carboxylase] ligase [Clostridia bacterium]